MWTCDYSPEEDGTDWPCARDWNRCRNISSSLRIQHWIYCIWIISGTQILCYCYQYPPEPPYIPTKFQMVIKLNPLHWKSYSYAHHHIVGIFMLMIIVFIWYQVQTWHNIWTRLRILGRMIQQKMTNLMDAKTQQDIHIEMLYRGNQGHRWLWLPILIHGSEGKNANGPKQKWKHQGYHRPMGYMSDEVFRAIAKRLKKYGYNW